MTPTETINPVTPARVSVRPIDDPRYEMSEKIAIAASMSPMITTRPSNR